MKAVILLSGGLDSAVALARAEEMGYEIHALTFIYGQRNLQEVEAAKRIAKERSVSHLVVDISEYGRLAESALTSISFINSGKRPPTYVPGRNLVFLSIAAGYAETIKASAIFVGFNSMDDEGYPDCRRGFLRQMEAALNLGISWCAEGGKKISIVAPLLEMDKRGIVLEARRLGIDVSRTVSCYTGTDCGKCDACIKRNEAIQNEKDILRDRK